jgi:predicted nucleic acid-binding protein
MSRIFLDTNVLLYTLDDTQRGARARRALLEATAISVQVLNEFATVVRRRQLLQDDELWHVESRFRQLLAIAPLTVELHEAALHLSSRYGFHFYDSLIVAAAQECGCDVLYTEDLQHNQRIGDLRIVDPFR